LKPAAGGEGILVGTGVACVTRDFGAGADCTLSAVAISPEGPDRHPLRCRRNGNRDRHRACQSRGRGHRRRRLNAIYDATGHRFQSLPITEAMIKGVLQ
jgi:CO/xanthine dehydrogenase Mo-binding subunit